MMAVFRIFLPNTFYGFPGSAKEVTLRSRGKTVTTKGPLTVRGMHDKPSLFSMQPLPIMIVGSYCREDYEQQETISQTSRGWNDILWTLTLDRGPSSIYSSVASFQCGNNFALRSRGINAVERLSGIK